MKGTTPIEVSEVELAFGGNMAKTIASIFGNSGGV